MSRNDFTDMLHVAPAKKSPNHDSPNKPDLPHKNIPISKAIRELIVIAVCLVVLLILINLHAEFLYQYLKRRVIEDYFSMTQILCQLHA